MNHFLLSEVVDLRAYPEIVSLDEGYEITLGDLHGNALKLLYILVSNDIIEISQENYLAFVAIYLSVSITSPLTAENLAAFRAVLESMTVKRGSVRLIGDEFADRGANDYFTLKILEKLHQNQVHLELLISNHGIEFLQACESYTTTGQFLPKALKDLQSISLTRLNDLVKAGLVAPEEILSFAEHIYIPNLKVLSYSYQEAHSEFILFSHAPIGLNVVEALAQDFGVEFDNTNIQRLMHTIDRINDAFQARANAKTVYATLCKDDVMLFFGGTRARDVRNSPYADLMGAAFVCTLWNRDLRFIEPYRSSKLHEVSAYFVHGHDSVNPEKSHIINLDFENELGHIKQIFIHCHQGKMNVLISLQAAHLKLPAAPHVQETQIVPYQGTNPSLPPEHLREMLMHMARLLFIFNIRSTLNTSIGRLSFFKPDTSRGDATLYLRLPMHHQLNPVGSIEEIVSDEEEDIAVTHRL